jgi:hypothetical protein
MSRQYFLSSTKQKQYIAIHNAPAIGRVVSVQGLNEGHWLIMGRKTLCPINSQTKYPSTPTIVPHEISQNYIS